MYLLLSVIKCCENFAISLYYDEEKQVFRNETLSSTLIFRIFQQKKT